MAQAMTKAKQIHARYADAILADIAYAHKHDLEQVCQRRYSSHDYYSYCALERRPYSHTCHL